MTTEERGMSMTRKLILELCLALCLWMATATAQEVWLKETDYPVTTKDVQGEIVRPRVCPVDSSWVAFEVWNQSLRRLFICKRRSGEAPRELDPSKSGESDEERMLRGAPMSGELAWRPVGGKGDKIWAAFVSKATGIPRLCLYELTEDKYYTLPCREDFLQGSKYDLAWSPDGYCLTYTSTHNGEPEVCVLRNMKKVLEDPKDPLIADKHQRLISGDGYASHAAWCPAPNSGYIAYLHQEKGGRCTIRIYDPLSPTGMTYSFLGAERSTEYFAPSWSPSGTKLAYYQVKMKDGSSLLSLSEIRDSGGFASYGLGLADVTTLAPADSLKSVETVQAGRSKSGKITDVAWNRDLFLGPAWLADDYHLLISLYDEPGRNPLRSVNTEAWRYGGKQKEVLFPVGEYHFPRDVSVSGNAVAFAFSLLQECTLGAGQIGGLPEPPGPLEYLEVSKDRERRWKDFRTDVEPSLPRLVWHMMKNPAIGPDIILNRPIVTIPVGAFIYLVTRQKKVGGLTPTTDWTLPQFRQR